MANPLSVMNLRIAFAARLLKRSDQQTIPSWWDGIINDACGDAYQVVLERLQVRGYSIAQIDAWPRCEDFVRRIALCQIFNEGQGIHAFDDKITAKAYCAAEEQLETVMVTGPDGVIETPALSGLAASGSLTWVEQLVEPDTATGEGTRF